MAVDVREAVTRKLGPLPVWAWAGIIAAAYLGAKVLRGGTGASGIPLGPGAPGTVGEPGAAGEPGEAPDLSDLTDRIASLTEQLTGQGETIAGLGTSVTNLTSFNALQQKLIDALKLLSTAQVAFEKYSRLITDTKLLYQNGKITKAERDKRIAEYTASRDAQQAIITKQSDIITDLQKQITALGA